GESILRPSPIARASLPKPSLDFDDLSCGGERDIEQEPRRDSRQDNELQFASTYSSRPCPFERGRRQTSPLFQSVLVLSLRKKFLSNYQRPVVLEHSRSVATASE